MQASQLSLALSKESSPSALSDPCRFQIRCVLVRVNCPGFFLKAVAAVHNTLDFPFEAVEGEDMFDLPAVTCHCCLVSSGPSRRVMNVPVRSYVSNPLAKRQIATSHKSFKFFVVCIMG